MINEVHIKNFALIDEITVSFYQGLNVLTGETGAGKSIIIGAINALGGDRVASDVIKSGKDYAFIELSFNMNDFLASLLERYDISDDGDLITLSRKIIAGGRSVYKINGEKVSAKIMKEFFVSLIDIHSQKDQMLLLKKDQTSLIDSFMDDEGRSVLATYLEKYDRLKSIKSKLKADADKGISLREAELLKFEIDEIASLSLLENEDDILEEEYATLSNARSILESLYSSLNILDDDSYGLSAGVAQLVSHLGGLKDYNDDLDSLYSTSIDVQEILSDLHREISAYVDGFELDDERLAEISDRLGEINKLKSKYKCSVNEIFEILDEKSSKYDFIMDYEDTRLALEKERDELVDELESIAGDLTDIRGALATTLSASIEKVLEELSLEDCRVQIVVERVDDINELGFNTVEIRVSTNKNEPFKPIYEVASGGEMSRIMLAIKSVLSEKSQGISMVFDEIDSGISGRTAGKVAAKMDDLARRNQVICITHLPQIAAFSDHHYLIEKAEKDDRVISDIHKIDDKDVYKEVARLIGGVTINEATITASKDMVRQAREYKGK